MIKKLLVITMVVIISACSTLQKELSNYVKEPEVTYKSIAVGKMSMQAIELIPTFNVANKNNFSLPINAISYELLLNNKQMLAGESDDIGTLSANGEKDVSLSLDLTQETLTSLQQLLFKDKKLDYQIKGDVKAMGVTIPFEKSATLYVPQVKINDLQVNSATFNELDIVLSVDIDNQNDFSLPLEDVNYSVSSQGKMLFKGGLESQRIAQGKNTINLPLKLKPSDLFSNIFTLLLSPELPLKFEITTPMFSKSYEQSLNLSSFFK
jgi:LEA14-like dessication related protein